jgi:hypothetical protein
LPRYGGRTGPLGDEHNLILVVFAQVDAKTKKARPAAAAAAASLAAGTTDELDDYTRRVEIVAMLLDLNAEATTLDPLLGQEALAIRRAPVWRIGWP